MEVRFIIRTHREVSHPGIFIPLIRECTSATQSVHVDIVGKKLHNIFKDSDHRLSNPGGATFSVEMSKQFGFLTSNCFWDWKGKVINVLARGDQPEIPDSYFVLTSYEKILFFRYYLETQGAAILEFGKELLERGNISRREFTSSPYVEEIFVRIWHNYLPLTQQIQQRTKLRRNIENLMRRGYSTDTRPHKFVPILNPLQDFGLLEPIKDEYKPIIVDNKVPLQILIDELKDVKQMEERFKNFDYFAIIKNCFNLGYQRELTLSNAKLKTYITSAYSSMKQDKIGLVSIDAIIDIVSVKALIDKTLYLSRHEIIKHLERIQSENPYNVRFHVNRRGERAFVTMDI